MNLSDIAKKHGLSKNYFPVMKIEAKETYDFIKSLDKDFNKAFSMYLAHRDDVLKRYDAMYYELLQNRKISDFARSMGVVYQRIYNLALYRENPTHLGIKSRFEILQKYEAYKNETP